MVKHIKGILFVLLVSALLPACAVQGNAHLSDGYQFGDITKTAASEAVSLAILRYRYCNAYSFEARIALLDVIRALYPEYPVEGICTEVSTLLYPEEGAADSLGTHQP